MKIVLTENTERCALCSTDKRRRKALAFAKKMRSQKTY
jgi:hypothetical protein